MPKGVIIAAMWLFAAGVALAASRAPTVPTSDVPTIYLIGDSTVNNGTKGQRGWGSELPPFVDATRARVVNRARGGRSSRTFLTEGLWKQVADSLKPGDFVLMQFGHNDGGGLNDPRNRASIKGIDDETQTVERDGKPESVHTYGWYLRQYVREARAKGATPIVLSPVPRNIWRDGKVARASADYGLWAKQVALQERCPFIDLNELVAKRYETDGQPIVAGAYFGPTDHTHTTPDGARVTAQIVADALRGLKGSAIASYMAPPPH